jgi:hypothetical protein
MPKAFARSAATLRFVNLDILLKGVFALECARSSFSSTLVYRRRIRFLAVLANVSSSVVHRSSIRFFCTGQPCGFTTHDPCSDVRVCAVQPPRVCPREAASPSLAPPRLALSWRPEWHSRRTDDLKRNRSLNLRRKYSGSPGLHRTLEINGQDQKAYILSVNVNRRHMTAAQRADGDDLSDAERSRKKVFIA